MRWLILVFNWLIFTTPSLATLPWVDFDYSMMYNPDEPKSALYQELSEVYYKNNPGRLECFTTPLIPKKIHQIWLGPLDIPKQYLESSKTWKELHPAWEYKLWREADIENWDFATKDLFNKASSYQEKADILRYEILNKFGGLYVDMDYKAIKPMDELHCLYNFYGSVEHPISEDNNPLITNAIIASRPNSEILNHTLLLVRQRWNHAEANFRNGAKDLHDKTLIIYLAVNRTLMPYHNAVTEKITTMSSAVILPATYLGIETKDRLMDKIKRTFGITNRRVFFYTIHPETMAVHHRDAQREVLNLSNIEVNDSWQRAIYAKIKQWFPIFFS